MEASSNRFENWLDDSFVQRRAVMERNHPRTILRGVQRGRLPAQSRL